VGVAVNVGDGVVGGTVVGGGGAVVVGGGGGGGTVVTGVVAGGGGPVVPGVVPGGGSVVGLVAVAPADGDADGDGERTVAAAGNAGTPDTEPRRDDGDTAPTVIGGGGTGGVNRATGGPGCGANGVAAATQHANPTATTASPHSPVSAVTVHGHSRRRICRPLIPPHC
jgi:hypothetical protein